MQTVGIFELKTHCSKIIKDVADGKDICITNKNSPIAYLISKNKYNQQHDNGFKNFFALKQCMPLGTPEEIIKMRDEDRK